VHHLSEADATYKAEVADAIPRLIKGAATPAAVPKYLVLGVRDFGGAWS
jgi:hypothetical protein